MSGAAAAASLRPASAGDARLAFNAGVRVPAPIFDRVSSRDQRTRSGHPDRMNTNLLDTFYDVDTSVTVRGAKGARFSPLPARKKRESGRLTYCKPGAVPLCSNDLHYPVNFATQEPRLKGRVRIDHSTLRSPDPKYPFRGVRSFSAGLTEGTLGGAYPQADERHRPCPSIGKQTTRAQRGRAGFSGRDPTSDEWHSQQRPLNVKYTTVARRSDRSPQFGRQTKRHADGPFVSCHNVNSECYTEDGDDLGDLLSETDRADVHRSFSASKRRLGRSVLICPSPDPKVYAHAQRPVSRLQCGHYREVESEALFPRPKVRRHRFQLRQEEEEAKSKGGWPDSESERRPSAISVFD